MKATPFLDHRGRLGGGRVAAGVRGQCGGAEHGGDQGAGDEQLVHGNLRWVEARLRRANGVEVIGISAMRRDRLSGCVVRCVVRLRRMRDAFQPERRHHLSQPDGLLLEALGGGGRLFDERGVLLRHLVELGDGAIDLADPLALLRKPLR